MFDVATSPSNTDSPEPAKRLGVPLEPRRLVRALGRSKRILASFAVGGALAGVVVAKVYVARTYESAAVLGWEGASPVAGSEAPAGDRELKSIAEGVKTTQTLSDIRARVGKATTLESLGRRIEVRTKKDSDLLILAASGETPASTAELARAAMDVFLEQRLEIERARLEEDIKRRATNLEDAQHTLADARTRFDAFRTEKGLLDLPLERQAALDHLARLRSEADLAGAQADGSRAQVDIFTSAARGESAVAVLAEKELRPGKKRLAEARSELAGLEHSLDAQHPRVLALHAEIEALTAASNDAGYTSMAERTIGRNPHWEALEESLATAKAAEKEASTRKATYQVLASAAESQIAKFTTVEGEAARLLSDVKVGEQRVAELQTLHAVARDLVRTPRSGFRVLALPQEPDIPVKSGRTLVALVGGPLGLLLALLIVVVRELWGFRLKAPGEAAFWAELPVVASAPWPASKAIDDVLSDVLEGVEPDETLLFVAADAASVAAAEALTLEAARTTSVSKWDDPDDRDTSWLAPDADAKAARRASRDADRVFIVATAQRTSVLQLRSTLARVGRTKSTGVVLVGVGREFAMLPDRVGEPESLSPSPRRDERRLARQ